MNVLLVNKFLYPKGGDAISTLTTGTILASHKHEVYYWGMNHPDNPYYPFQEYFVSNIDYLNHNSPTAWMKASANILYSFEAKRKISALIEKIKPDVVHLNNFAHQISPSILDAIKQHHIPTVMTMRDYKMICPTYNLMTNGVRCDKCSGGHFYHCLFNRCTKKSLLKSFLNMLEMYLHHNILHIYDAITVYISPSAFLKQKAQEMGFNREIFHLPNCVDISSFVPEHEWQDKRIAYVGRLSHEKGIGTLIDAIKNNNQLRLKIIGDGPLRTHFTNKVVEENIRNVDFIGYQTGAKLHDEIRKSMFLVIPSECYENNPRTVIEAFALGKPVVGARIGGIPELVRDWDTGLTYDSGNVTDLKEKIDMMLGHANRIPEMGKKARKYVENELNADVHYQKLMGLYQLAKKKSASTMKLPTTGVEKYGQI